MLLSLLPLEPSAHGDEWQPVARGVDYRLYELDDPNRVHVARLSLSAPDVIVESSIASGELDQGFETVSGMAQRYQDAVIAWGGELAPLDPEREPSLPAASAEGAYLVGGGWFPSFDAGPFAFSLPSCSGSPAGPA